MNIIEFLIIYLTLGAPCGVYFFFQNTNKLTSKKLLLKSLVTVFVWIPYAFKLLHDFATTKFRTSPFNAEFAARQKLQIIQKELSQLLPEAEIAVSLFEFREVLDRFAGLSLACNYTDNKPTVSERELFRISLHQNIELGAECLQRRNHFRLKFHQKLASRDFLQIITRLYSSRTDRERIKRLALEFAEILADVETQKSLDVIFNKTLQSASDLPVEPLENEVWKPREHKQFSSNRASMPSQGLKMWATTKKD